MSTAAEREFQDCKRIFKHCNLGGAAGAPYSEEWSRISLLLLSGEATIDHLKTFVHNLPEKLKPQQR